MLRNRDANIAVSTLKRFLARNPNYEDARDPMMAWARKVAGADWSTPAEMKRDIGTASILQDGRAVFNIAGNKRPLTLAMIRRLHEGLGIPAESLIKAGRGEAA